MDINFEQLRSVYLMGIGGVGIHVSGSDRQLYSPMKEYLEGLNIQVKIGFREENLNPEPELIIVGNVITRDNPEAQEMLRRNIPYISMPEAIRQFFLKGKDVIVVAGTHGKTTTTALLGWILKCAGKEPGVLLGGVSKDFNSGFYLGKGKHFVIEGDEYDTAFFDKVPKFLHYTPHNLILTTIEFDHGDIYRNLEEVKNSFRRLVQIIPEDGCIVYGSYSVTAGEVLEGVRCSCISAGEDGLWDFKALIKNGYTECTAVRNKKNYMRFRWKKYGLQNIRNCLMAIAMSEHLGLSPEDIQKGIESYEGVKRRQEEIGEFGGVLLIDDFAHHPTEVKETISGIKLRYPERRLWAVFEPRSNTSRRNFFQKLYPDAFMDADGTIISDIFNRDAINEDERLNPWQIVLDLNKRGKNAFFIESVDKIVEFLKWNAKKSDVILIMSNGSFGGIVEKLRRAFT